MIDFNMSEYEAVRKRVTQDLADNYCLNDAVAEIIYDAYEEVYGVCPDDMRESAEYWVRLNRMDDYAIDALQELNNEIVENGELACRCFDLFEMAGDDVWEFRARRSDKMAQVRVSRHGDTYVAVEYDDDGDETHRGEGRTPQDALYSMRLVLDVVRK